MSNLIRTQKIKIKKGHKLYNYFHEMSFNSKNLYNTTNYYVRQVLTASKKEDYELSLNETDILNTINSNIDKVNDIRINNINNKRLKEQLKSLENRKQIEDAKLYSLIDKENKYVSFELLDAIFKITKNRDYIALPSQVNQQTMKQVFQDWQSFYESIKDYNTNSSKYTGKPRIPKYAKKTSRKLIILTNQNCKIKENKYLSFPKTKHQLNIGKLGLIDGELKQVRVIPLKNYYEVEVVLELNNQTKKLKTTEPKKIFSIDLGINNFATITNNIGERPFIIKGKVLKSINQYYNKQRAYYYGILRQGQQPKKGKFNSNKLNSLDSKRNAKIKDYMHKASFNIIKEAELLEIDTIVIGKNDTWKTDIQLRKDVKLNFTSIPYSLFIQLLKYKAEEKGIRVIITEESYTSKASFVDGDFIPTYGKENQTYKFSGKRIKRGLYKTKESYLINADVNASLNILRKAIPNANVLWNIGLVSSPLMLSIA